MTDALVKTQPGNLAFDISQQQHCATHSQSMTRWTQPQRMVTQELVVRKSFVDNKSVDPCHCESHMKQPYCLYSGYGFYTATVALTPMLTMLL